MRLIQFLNIKLSRKWLFSLVCLFLGAAVYGATATRFLDVIVKTSLSVGSNSAANSKSALDVVSTTKGFLEPRMTTVQRDAISSPTTGLQVYNSTTNYPNYYNGTSWLQLSSLTGTETFTNKTLTSPTITTPTTDILILDDQASAPSNPSAGYYKVYAKTDGKVYILNSSGTESQVGGGGGGGSIFMKWIESGEAPLEDVENNAAVKLFQAGLSQNLYADFRVPSSYQAGSPITLYIHIYSPDTSGDILIRAQATLIRSEVDDIASTTNQRTTTNSAITMSAANDNEIQKVTLDISSSIGEINAVAISAGDEIRVRLYRDTDTATSDVRLITNSSEVTLQ